MSYLGKHIASLERDIRALDRQIEETCGDLVRERQRLHEALEALEALGNGNEGHDQAPPARQRRQAYQRLGAAKKRELALEALTDGRPELLASDWAAQRAGARTGREYLYWRGLMSGELRKLEREGVVERVAGGQGTDVVYRLAKRSIRIRPGEGEVK